MIHTVESLAALVKGTVRGDSQCAIDDAAAIEAAGSSAVTFVLDQTQLRRLEVCQAAAIVVDRKIADAVGAAANATLIVVDDAQAAFQTILPLFRRVRGRPARGISSHAQISTSAKVGADCYIAAGVVIDDDVVIGSNCDLYPGVVIGAGCQVGDNTILHPNVVLYHDVELGENVIVHGGAVIGADGFGYRFAGGKFVKIPQLGNVQIHDNVEIGACSTIDRGAIGPTVIGEGTKIDNLVMIAHNCEVGRHNVFASQVGVAGSSSTGDYVRLGGQAGLRDHIHVGTGCSVGAKGGVTKDIPDGETWIGIPAMPESEQKRQLVAIKRIPDIRDQVHTLEKQVAAMTAELEQLRALLGQPGSSVPRRAAG